MSDEKFVMIMKIMGGGTGKSTFSKGNVLPDEITFSMNRNDVRRIIFFIEDF